MPSRKVVVGAKQLVSTKLLGLSGTSSFLASSTVVRRDHHAHREDHHVKDFVRDLAGFGDVAHLQVAVCASGIDAMHPGADQAGPPGP